MQQHGLNCDHLSSSQCEMHLFEHIFNGNCFGGAGTACRALSHFHTPKQLGLKLLDDVESLLRNDAVHLLVESQKLKLRAIGAALGLSETILGPEIPLSDIKVYLSAWSMSFQSCSDVDNIILSVHQFSAIETLQHCRAHNIAIPPTMTLDGMTAALTRHIVTECCSLPIDSTIFTRCRRINADIRDHHIRLINRVLHNKSGKKASTNMLSAFGILFSPNMKLVEYHQLLREHLIKLEKEPELPRQVPQPQGLSYDYDATWPRLIPVHVKKQLMVMQD
jgi:hypothetical protein